MKQIIFKYVYCFNLKQKYFQLDVILANFLPLDV